MERMRPEGGGEDLLACLRQSGTNGMPMREDAPAAAPPLGQETVGVELLEVINNYSTESVTLITYQPACRDFDVNSS